MVKTTTIAGIPTPTVGHGLMYMTWKPTPVPDELCFAAMKTTIDALPDGAKAFFNSSESTT